MAIAAELLNRYLTERLDPLCDDCLAMALGFTQRQQAAGITQTLGTTGDFNRYIGICADCKCTRKTVTQRL